MGWAEATFLPRVEDGQFLAVADPTLEGCRVDAFHMRLLPYRRKA